MLDYQPIRPTLLSKLLRKLRPKPKQVGDGCFIIAISGPDQALVGIAKTILKGVGSTPVALSLEEVLGQGQRWQLVVTAKLIIRST